MKRRKLFALALTLIMFAALLSAAVSADAAEDAPDASDGFSAVINDFDSTYYNDGKTVFNNYGTVYNNGGTVYNNAGIVYNNGGTVYNNGGTVYNNSGTVYNNGGEVIGNSESGEVFDSSLLSGADTVPDSAENDGNTEQELPSVADGRHKITLAADYSRFAYIEGPDKIGLDYFMEEDSEIRITAKAGFTLLNSGATTGRCTMQEDGSVVFSNAEKDGMLTLAFKVDAPVITPEFGTYGEAQRVKIIVPDGVTVYYSTDGEKIVDETSSVYSEPIEILFSTSLQVMAAADGAENSRTVSGRYLIPIIIAPSFDAQKEGYKPIEAQAITVENTGIERLRIESAVLTGENADCFTLGSENGAVIEAGQRDRSSWNVAPADNLKAGEYEATVEFTFSNGNKAAVELTFTVTK